MDAMGDKQMFPPRKLHRQELNDITTSPVTKAFATVNNSFHLCFPLDFFIVSSLLIFLLGERHLDGKILDAILNKD